MEYVVCVLIVIVLFLWHLISKIKQEAKAVDQTWRNTVAEKEQKILSITREHENLLAQLADGEAERDRLRKLLDETQRKLEFYKNIEEASGNLNVDREDPKRKELLVQVVQQIVAEQNQSNNAHLSDGSKSLLDEEQAFALREMEHSNHNFFITGKAGTGKSFLLDIFRKTTSKSHVVLAPTGIAALNVRGATLHSVFGYKNLVELDVDAISLGAIQLKSEKKMILKKVNTIIIDEISMVRVDTFEKIDRILRVITEIDKPFGGKQMILFGDLFQLPPVAKSAEEKFLYTKFGGIYFFCSELYKLSQFRFLELTINHRQKEDMQYFSLLNRIRDGSATDQDIALLNTRVVKDTSAYNRFTSLLPTKAEVERLNQGYIDQLETQAYTYSAQITLNKYPGRSYNLETIFPVANTLRLKKGALVMMVANDPEHKWVNGTLGIVSKLTKSSIFVAIEKRIYEVPLFEFSEQEITYTADKIVYEDILKVLQYPIVPAYAMTIHKSQGQTYQNIVCDINRCFASGQAYVALSRCASLNGLHLKQQVNRASIRVDRQVLDFYRSQKKETAKKESNAGKPWSSVEEQKLIEEYSQGLNREEMATIHGRTSVAIAARLVHLGVIQERKDIK